MIVYFVLMLAGVAAGYYAGVAAAKRLGKRSDTVVPIVTAIAGGLIAYFIALSIVPPMPSGPIAWAEPVYQVFSQEELDAVLADNPAKTTLVSFYADWCPPCHAEAPGLNELASAGERIAVVNVDRAPSLADRYNVGVLPTVVVFRNEKEVDRGSGYHSKRSLQRMMAGGAGS